MSKKPFIGQLRDVQQHEADVKNVKEKNYMGVMKTSPLSSLPKFDITKDLPHDPMHIIFEGLAKYHLIDILQVIIDGPGPKRTTIVEVNRRIKLFDFGFFKSRNKPNVIKDNILDDNPSLSMAAAQT